MKSTHMAAAWAKFTAIIPPEQEELAATLKMAFFVGAYEFIRALETAGEVGGDDVVHEVLSFCREFAKEGTVLQ